MLLMVLTGYSPSGSSRGSSKANARSTERAGAINFRSLDKRGAAGKGVVSDMMFVLMPKVDAERRAR